MTWIKQHAWWLKWVLAIALLGFLLWHNRSGLQDLSSRKIAWSFFATAVVVRFFALCLTFTRWWLLVTGINLPLRWMDSFRLGMLCEAFNMVGPGAAGGDLVKAVWLAKDHRERRASAAATVVLDRILGLWALFLSGALASLLPSAVPLGPEMKWAVYLLWAGTAGGLIGLCLMLIPAFTHSRLMHWVTTWPKVGLVVKDLMDSITFYQGRRQVIVFAAALSLVGHLGYLSSFYLCGLALHQGQNIPGYVDHLVGLPIPEVLAAVPLTPGGIGTLEAAVGFFYQQHQLAANGASTELELHAANANGLMTALGYRMSAVILAGIGVVYYFSRRREMSQAVDAEAAESEATECAAAASGDSTASPKPVAT